MQLKYSSQSLSLQDCEIIRRIAQNYVERIKMKIITENGDTEYADGRIFIEKSICGEC